MENTVSAATSWHHLLVITTHSCERHRTEDSHRGRKATRQQKALKVPPSDYWVFKRNKWNTTVSISAVNRCYKATGCFLLRPPPLFFPLQEIQGQTLHRPGTNVSDGEAVIFNLFCNSRGAHKYVGKHTGQKNTRKTSTFYFTSTPDTCLHHSIYHWE